MLADICGAQDVADNWKTSCCHWAPKKQQKHKDPTILVPRPNIRTMPETMVCRIFMFTWSFVALATHVCRASSRCLAVLALWNSVELHVATDRIAGPDLVTCKSMLLSAFQLARRGLYCMGSWSKQTCPIEQAWRRCGTSVNRTRQAARSCVARSFKSHEPQDAKTCLVSR